MNIIYFGTDVFFDVFRFFLENHRILALYTYHENEDYFTERNIVRLAAFHHIPIHYESISREQILSYFDEENCDLLFTAEYNRLLPVTADMEAVRGINIHSALLPRGRSYYPIEAGLYQKKPVLGVTLHKLTLPLDSGGILIQKAIETEGKDSIDIYLCCAAAALEMVKQIIPALDHYWLQAKEQPDILPFWKRPEEAAMTICHEHHMKEAAEIYRIFNKMTKVSLYGRLYTVDSLSFGSFMLPRSDEGIRWIRDNKILYGLADGHIRVNVEVL